MWSGGEWSSPSRSSSGISQSNVGVVLEVVEDVADSGSMESGCGLAHSVA